MMNRIRRIVLNWVMPKVQPGEAVIIVQFRMPDQPHVLVEMQVRSKNFRMSSSNGGIFLNDEGQNEACKGRRIQIEATEEVMNYGQMQTCSGKATQTTERRF